MLTRNILNGIICLIVFSILWMIVSGVEMVQERFGGDKGIMLNQAPDNIWIHVNEYYQNREDSSDKITPEEYKALLDAYNSGTIEVVEEPVAPENPEEAWIAKSNSSGSWVESVDYYESVTDSSVTISVDEYNKLMSDYASATDAYEQQKLKYDAYLKAKVSPEERYAKQVSHYRNRSNYEDYVKEDAYNDLVTEYQKKLEKGKIKDIDKDIPYQPIDPADIYYAYDADGNVIENYFRLDDKEKAQYEVSLVRSVLDGSLMTEQQVTELRATYLTEIEQFKKDYTAYLDKYYPDRDNKEMVFRVGPTKNKVIICFAVTGILFGILYMLFRKNLDAANLLSDTSDINQYHNDQHIALPEEVQRNYDWFPDVGAHSAVQVSSMISHMALLNKGLKKIDVATRADKDIKDEDGNIEYFKGEILEDENGNYITTTEPMIDDKFMEDLFDASGAPRDKNVRHRYDATKIPYNPDGSNRDKLGKFETVADLINEDWEFPIYEPQRPAGAYMVDTAPVNTIVWLALCI
jgi:hypothetical protein